MLVPWRVVTVYMNMFLILRSAVVSSFKTHHDALKGESCPPRCHFFPQTYVFPKHARKKPEIPYHLHRLSTFNQLNSTLKGRAFRMNAPLDASLLHYQAMKDDFTVDLKD